MRPLQWLKTGRHKDRFNETNEVGNDALVVSHI